MLNELLASNDTTSVDQNGEADDWIELFNPDDHPVSVGGWYLSDRTDSLMQWIFPDTTITANGFLIVWADEDEDQSGLHANFKLSASGETISLSQPGGSLVDQLRFGSQFTDVSIGRVPDGGASVRRMTPSPGSPNLNDNPDVPDPGTGIFGDMLIHSLELVFYTEHWQDSLRNNFEVLDKVYMPARLTVNDTLILDSIGVRYKGNSSYERSRNTPKKPFEFDFKRYIDDQNLNGLHRLNLSSGVSDPSYMRETIAYGIAREYLPAPRTAYADLFVNGELLGFYVLVEQMDKNFLFNNYQDNSGNFYKAGDDGATMEWRGESQSAYADEYELKTNEEADDWTRLVELLDALNNSSDAEFVNALTPLMDLNGAATFLALNMALSNFDSYTGSSRNFYLYDDPSSARFQILPWDMNEAFGAYANGWDVIEQDALEISNLDHRPLNRRLLANEQLRHYYLNKIEHMVRGPMSPDSIEEIADRLRPLIQPHVIADQNKLYTDAQFSENIEGDVVIDFGRRIPGIKSFARARGGALLLQFSSASVYPGDTDNNGTVDAADIMPIGFYFLRSGYGRDSLSVNWQAKQAALWNTDAMTYADANGDGTIDELDVVAIGVNWGLMHQAAGIAYPLDPAKLALDKSSHAGFRILLASLGAAGEANSQIRALLESILSGTVALPDEFTVSQNYPNPFNPTTNISFRLPYAQAVTVTVTDVLGRTAMTPVYKKEFEAGDHFIQLSADGLASGVYFYSFIAESGTQIHKMVVLK